MMKNFILKALFVLKLFKFFTRLFGHKEKGLDQNHKINFKIHDVTPGLETIAIYILPNISQSKGNQTMKFGQLTECNERNIFLQNLCRK